MIEIINIILICFILICAVEASRTSSLVSSAFLLGAMSFFLAILWSLLEAPDVSFTEAVVGAGASTIFFLLALFGTRHQVTERKAKVSWLALGIILVLGIFFVRASLDLPGFGDTAAVAHQYLSPYYLLNTYHDSKTPNAVTAIVVDYRAFDTLIEVAVIFTAGAACLLIFRREDEL